MEEVLKASAALTEYRYTMNPGLSPLGEKWIPREPRAVASARRFVHDVAADWNATGDIPEIAELLASELVTNAIAYGSTDTSVETPIRITVSGEKQLLTVDVYDSCIAIPRLRRADDLETTGRGLAIVQNLSRNWGWTLNPYGKSVWFQLLAWP
ncbi:MULTISPECIES: ATP-binding protein [unclassified Streptosporangium]|uniref:ATP-binding protein n=1 Tax=unclassified Streptosporangium TaxID=2632669 RepID=UPI002E2B0D94|nr:MULTISPECIES: ATP-binding protein [unclassified Streptosporangium]